MIGHAKADNRMDRCWLQGALGDALHAPSCATGHNIRWLLRTIVRLGLRLAFLRLLRVALKAALNAWDITEMGHPLAGGQHSAAQPASDDTSGGDSAIDVTPSPAILAPAQPA